MAKDLIYTPVFRVSFPSVFTPKEAKDANGSPKLDSKGNPVKGKYEVTMIFSKETEAKTKAIGYSFTLQAIKDEVLRVAKEKWGDKLNVPTFRDSIKWPIKDGSKKVKVETGETYPGYGEGTEWLRAATQYPIGLVDQDRNPILAEKDFYAGCYGIATVSVYAGETKGENNTTIKYVGVGLGNIQKVADGEKLGAASRSAEDDFKPIVSNDLDLSDIME